MKNYTIEQFTQLLAKNGKQWINGTFNIIVDGEILPCGVKSYGLWVQRIDFCGCHDGIPEQKTQKTFKLELTKMFNNMINARRAIS